MKYKKGIIMEQLQLKRIAGALRCTRLFCGQPFERHRENERGSATLIWGVFRHGLYLSDLDSTIDLFCMAAVVSRASRALHEGTPTAAHEVRRS